jgi:hypothetical protein
MHRTLASARPGRRVSRSACQRAQVRALLRRAHATDTTRWLAQRASRSGRHRRARSRLHQTETVRKSPSSSMSLAGRQHLDLSLSVRAIAEHSLCPWLRLPSLVRQRNNQTGGRSFMAPADSLIWSACERVSTSKDWTAQDDHGQRAWPQWHRLTGHNHIGADYQPHQLRQGHQPKHNRGHS